MGGNELICERERTLPPDQFEVRPVRTKRGTTMVGLFSAAITRAERKADAPYREAMAVKRLARMTRAERRDGAIDSSSQRGGWSDSAFARPFHSRPTSAYPERERPGRPPSGQGPRIPTLPPPP